MPEARSEEGFLNKLMTLVMVCVGVAGVASAAVVPEIDPGSGVNALALLAAGVLVFRGRRKK